MNNFDYLRAETLDQAVMAIAAHPAAKFIAGGTRAAPPRFAEHTEAVLARHGFSEAEIAALREDGTLVEARRR